jgi:hypothetical protein
MKKWQRVLSDIRLQGPDNPRFDEDVAYIYQRMLDLEQVVEAVHTAPTKIFRGNVTAYVPNYLHQIAGKALENGDES